jgi:NAD(P)-dependent dehydrogenase (short-subunit alcohol dehydrogenase family)
MAVTKMKNVVELDLASPSAIDRFANEFLNSDRALDLLINNAGHYGNSVDARQRGYELNQSARQMSVVRCTRIVRARNFYTLFCYR